MSRPVIRTPRCKQRRNQMMRWETLRCFCWGGRIWLRRKGKRLCVQRHSSSWRRCTSGGEHTCIQGLGTRRSISRSWRGRWRRRRWTRTPRKSRRQGRRLQTQCLTQVSLQWQQKKAKTTSHPRMAAKRPWIKKLIKTKPTGPFPKTCGTPSTSPRGKTSILISTPAWLRSTTKSEYTRNASTRRPQNMNNRTSSAKGRGWNNWCWKNKKNYNVL